ncbi:MAG: HAD hydrolase family protein, partial [Candidatus Nitrosotenuis sp.]
TDVDGVLTDGGMYYTNKGDIMKKFHVRDGMGVTLLRKCNIPTLIVTKEETEMVRQWARRMKIKKLYDGVVQKDVILEQICKTFKVKVNEIAYIGDDINDIKLLDKVGLSAVPNDGILEAKKICHYICKSKGGNGAFREFADLILSKQH